ncbi:MAG: nuclease-related domain-containing protein [Bdellovibrionales bacterium]
MAVMHPPQLSERVLNNPRLRGEVKVYWALYALPDEFEVFYNRSVSRDSAAQAYSRRIDFVVLHERLGFLAIEVKGGKIRIGDDGEIQQYHPSNDAWATINPYRQIELSTMELIRNAKADGANYYIVGNTCVVFPDSLRKDITDMPNRLPNGTLCAEDLEIISAQMKTLFSKNWRDCVWKRDAFLDMRRRLNNMPESSRPMHVRNSSYQHRDKVRAQRSSSESRLARTVSANHHASAYTPSTYERPPSSAHVHRSRAHASSKLTTYLRSDKFLAMLNRLVFLALSVLILFVALLLVRRIHGHS